MEEQRPAAAPTRPAEDSGVRVCSCMSVKALHAVAYIPSAKKNQTKQKHTHTNREKHIVVQMGPSSNRTSSSLCEH